jgi:3-phosphoshikimate 1-carboxyvinyltransferase
MGEILQSKIWDWPAEKPVGARLATGRERCQKPGTMKDRGPQPAAFEASPPLSGTLAVPGDKSISHRALMIAAMAAGRSRIEGLSEGEDVRSTAGALSAMGVRIAPAEDGAWTVDGVGTGALLQPERALDMGNSGTSARLLVGLASSHRLTATFTGDSSLSRRPMERVAAPLRRIGADIACAPGGRLPLTVRGLCPAIPRTHRLEIASAQVKSALLLAALNIPGETRVIEPAPTRDHSERMLEAFGADIARDGNEILLRGEAGLRARALRIPGDPSSAAFLLTAALIVPGSEVTVTGVGTNPTRTGYFETLRAMGAGLSFANEHIVGGEPVADVTARHSPLAAVEVEPESVPAMIDEFPIFFVAAAFARGTSRATGIGELRLKESDRIAAMAEALEAIGARVRQGGDWIEIEGSSGEPLAGGADIASRLDHRIAMSLAVAGLHCRSAVIVDDMSAAATSFPGFAEALSGLAR